MPDTIRQHEIIDGICKHCGAFKITDEVTCVSREFGKPDDMRPEPMRRMMAADDADTIAARIAELRTEKDVAMNQPAKEAEE